VITIVETLDCRGDGDKEAKETEKVSHFLFHQITNDRDHLRPELWTGMTSSCLPRQPKEKGSKFFSSLIRKQNIKEIKRNKTFNIPANCLSD